MALGFTTSSDFGSLIPDKGMTRQANPQVLKYNLAMDMNKEQLME